MSYYYKSKFKITDHALARFRERAASTDVNIKNLSGTFIIAIINERILGIRPLNSLDNNFHIYMDRKNKGYYFLVDKYTNAIVSYTKRANKNDIYYLKNVK
ncbi:hypothetical protein [Ureaplasma parvum]|uniref:hypothetical protein n=1 Tax=Ureaplasma parvum TaxID=134821 RepID=UPI0026EFA043|nr:hypothetical protein [Ureaplasma parvum]